MRKLLLLALLFSAPAMATTPLPVYCIAATLAVCNSLTQVGNGTQGDIWWKAFGKVNDIGYQLGVFSSSAANEVEATPNGSSGLPSLRALVSADLPTALTNQTSINNSSVPASAGTLTGSTGSFTLNDCLKVGSTSPLEVADAGAACGSGGSSAFSSLTGGTNTTAAMLVGTGATLGPTGTGLLTANAVPGYATASLPTCNSGAKGEIAYTTDGTPAFTFCNGTTWTSTGGTQFTYAATGCTPSAASGDATGGSITLAAGPCTSITVTFNGAVGMTAPHLWVCTVSDPALNGPTSWFGSWGASSYTSTTATFQIPGAAGATDTITFSCDPH